MLAALVRLSQRWQVEATGVKMMTWTKIKDDFWIVETSGYRKEITDLLRDAFAKENVRLIVLSDRVKE